MLRRRFGSRLGRWTVFRNRAIYRFWAAFRMRLRFRPGLRRWMILRVHGRRGSRPRFRSRRRGRMHFGARSRRWTSLWTHCRRRPRLRCGWVLRMRHLLGVNGRARRFRTSRGHHSLIVRVGLRRGRRSHLGRWPAESVSLPHLRRGLNIPVGGKRFCSPPRLGAFPC